MVWMVHCIAHVLQLGLREGLKCTPIIDAAIGRFRDLAKKIVDSPKLQESMALVATNLKKPVRKMELDCETRWNSTLEMMTSIIDNRKVLEELLRRIRDKHEGYTDFTITWAHELAKEISPSSWAACSDFCLLLQPFKDATVLMSASSYPTLGMTLPVMHIITAKTRQAVSEPEAFGSEHTKQFALAVLRKLEDYRGITSHLNLQIAAALDPRVKPLMRDMSIEIDELKQCLIKDWEDEYETQYEQQRYSDDTSARDQSRTRNTFLQFFHSDNSSLREREPFSSEIDRYFAHAPMDITQSSREVADWFKVNKVLYPRIQRMARDYLGVTATSVPSECAFSRAGATVSHRRARMGDDAVQAICELQSMVKFNEIMSRKALIHQ
jgi:hAT family C-terminal dimerisation region